MEREKLLDPDRSKRLEFVANFMGHEKFTKKLVMGRSEGEPELVMDNWWKIDDLEYQTGSLLYDTSYDWLMKVYKKIIRVMDEFDNKIEYNYNTIRSMKISNLNIHFNIMYDRLADGDDIEEVFEWAVKCIGSIKALEMDILDQNQ